MMAQFSRPCWSVLAGVLLLSLISSVQAASSGVNPNTKKLLDALMPYAERAIGQSGSMVPFGGALSPDGKIHFLQAEAKQKVETPEQLRDLLIGSTKGMVQPKGFVAAAVLSDTDVRNPKTKKLTRAVRADLRFRNGQTETLYIPFQQSDGGKLSFGVSFPHGGKL